MTEASTAARWQFSLKRLLIAFFFLAVSFGCLRIASVGEYPMAVIPGVLCLGLALGLVTNRIAISLALVAVLALASYVTTGRIWDGGYPSGEIRLQVVDEAGAPIAGARLDEHFRDNLQSVHHPYLLLEEDQLPLLTDAKGIVACHSLGKSFGGTGWDLFWCVPMESRRLEYEIRISHKDYDGPVSLQLFELLDYRKRSAPDKTIIVDGQPESMQVNTTTVTMHGR